MMNLPKLIALKGVMFSGKSTVARYLVDEHGYTRTRFAGPLKAMLAAFLEAKGASAALIERMVEGDLKMVPSPFLYGKTPRHAMQTLGTEWGRDLISPTLWIDAWRGRAQGIIAAGGRVVVDDCRFPNEANLVGQDGGWVVEVVNDRANLGQTAGAWPTTDEVPGDSFYLHGAYEAMMAAFLRESGVDDVTINRMVYGDDHYTFSPLIGEWRPASFLYLLDIGWHDELVRPIFPVPAKVATPHVSETMPFAADATIRNNGTSLALLHTAVDDMLFTLAGVKVAA